MTWAGWTVAVGAGLWLACGSSGGGETSDTGADVTDATESPDPVEVPGTPDGSQEMPSEVLPEAGTDEATEAAAELPHEVGPEVPAEVGPDPTGDGGGPDDHGFALRDPGDNDIDYVCRVQVPGVFDGWLYVQTTEESCTMMMGCTYDVVGAWTSVEGGVAPVAASYDYGGNHHNDAITFAAGGKSIVLYHSYFGYGWRACTPPDCARVMTADGGQVLEDGCVEGERSIPVQCVQVCDDGTLLPPRDFPACPEAPSYYVMFDEGCAAGTW